MLYLLACKTFTEDKVLTADVVSYSKAHFCCIYLHISENDLEWRADLKTWYLCEYFHNQSARCYLKMYLSTL